MKPVLLETHSEDIFRKLSFEHQWDYTIVRPSFLLFGFSYAFWHYEVPDAAHLTSDDICYSLCIRNYRIPALVRDDHIRFSTSQGLIIEKDVIDIIDWIVNERAEELTGASSKSSTLSCLVPVRDRSSSANWMRIYQ